MKDIKTTDTIVGVKHGANGKAALHQVHIEIWENDSIVSERDLYYKVELSRCNSEGLEDK